MFLDYSDNIATHFGLSCGVVTSTPLVEYTPQTPCFVRFKSPVKNVELKPAKSNFYEPILCPVNQYEDPYFNSLRTSGFKEEKQVYSSLKNDKFQGNFKKSLLVYRSIEMDPFQEEKTIKAPTTANEGHEFTVRPMPSSGGLNIIFRKLRHGSFKFMHCSSIRSKRTTRAHDFRSRRRQRSGDERQKRMRSKSPSRNRALRFRPRRETLRLRNENHRNCHRHYFKQRYGANAPRFGDDYYRNDRKYGNKQDMRRYRSATPRRSLESITLLPSLSPHHVCGWQGAGSVVSWAYKLSRSRNCYLAEFDRRQSDCGPTDY
ncbi:hypothetical protein ACTXT7_005436 [Hymenolepis weldensis]